MEEFDGVVIVVVVVVVCALPPLPRLFGFSDYWKFI
jgi:low affinity Fe/Cu permease